MALPNPVDINVNAVDKDMFKINQDNFGSTYRLLSSVEKIDLKIRHQSEKPNAAGVVFDRHNVDLTRTVFSTGAGIPDIVTQCYVVFRHANNDLSVHLPYLVIAMADLLKESAFVTDLISWQN